MKKKKVTKAKVKQTKPGNEHAKSKTIKHRINNNIKDKLVNERKENGKPEQLYERKGGDNAG